MGGKKGGRDLEVLGEQSLQVFVEDWNKFCIGKEHKISVSV